MGTKSLADKEMSIKLQSLSRYIKDFTELRSPLRIREITLLVVKFQIKFNLLVFESHFFLVSDFPLKPEFVLDVLPILGCDEPSLEFAK